MSARGGLRRCAYCGCEQKHHKRNVYRDSGIAKAGEMPRGPIVGRRLGKCWFAGCRGGCRGWRRAGSPVAA